MKNAIATISTDAGIMVIYYNGENEHLTAESADMVGTILDERPRSIEHSKQIITRLWGDPVWDLRWLGEEALYTIKDEYLEEWGVMGDEQTVSGPEIVRLADEWGVSIAKLMEQVEAWVTYKIIHTEELVGHFFVKAASKEDALLKFEHEVFNGKIDFSDMEMINSSDEVVKCTDNYSFHGGSNEL